jgi:hypothetical protein
VSVSAIVQLGVGNNPQAPSGEAEAFSLDLWVVG